MKISKFHLRLNPHIPVAFQHLIFRRVQDLQPTIMHKIELTKHEGCEHMVFVSIGRGSLRFRIW